MSAKVYTTSQWYETEEIARRYRDVAEYERGRKQWYKEQCRFCFYEGIVVGAFIMLVVGWL